MKASTLMKLAIQKRNSAMEECVDVLVLGNNVFTVGKTDYTRPLLYGLLILLLLPLVYHFVRRQRVRRQ